jgi:hypothetical protein
MQCNLELDLQIELLTFEFDIRKRGKNCRLMDVSV